MESTEAIAASFDARAAKYAQNDWHRKCAERLVALCEPQRGQSVLDVCTGTGFAAIAAARRVGIDGKVIGIDISSGMLAEAHRATVASGLANVNFVLANALDLRQYQAGTFDLITCAAGLLYLPVVDALREWRRLLRPGGIVGFSSMQIGAPPAARIFRECAARFGVVLGDPSESLGSPDACRQALETAGFRVRESVAEQVEFGAQDMKLAWESNFQSAAHADVKRLSLDEQNQLREMYVAALTRMDSINPDELRRAGMLYVVGC